MLNSRLFPLLFAMAVLVVASNILVAYPFTPFGLGEVLTYGAFTYPFAFLVTDLANRWHGPVAARRVVYSGFALAVALSLILADPRIALASGTAFLSAQLLDVFIFDRLRAKSWWLAPAVSSFFGSALDTALFFSLAFVGTGVPWLTLALGDFTVKILIALLALVPYAHLMRRLNAYAPRQESSA